MAEVIIGVDPHKLSATIEIVDRQERLVATGRFNTDQRGYTAMRSYARTFPHRLWAVEGANGTGRPCHIGRSPTAAWPIGRCGRWLSGCAWHKTVRAWRRAALM